MQSAIADAPSAATDITLLHVDHPGAQDRAYRARRDEIAAVARQHRLRGLPMPALRYRDDEHATWRSVATRLEPLHQRHACASYLEARRRLRIETDRIPDLAALSLRLQREQGFALLPIEGLIESRLFLGRLAARAMSCTLYLRHGSRPEYTPEPDVIHEVIGHVPLFADSGFAALSAAIGRAALAADDAMMTRLDRLYWFTLEFGLIEEPAGLRAYGAGLLSSSGELPHAFSDAVERRPFALDEVLETPYDFTRMQPLLFVIPSFAALAREVERLAPAGR